MILPRAHLAEQSDGSQSHGPGAWPNARDLKFRPHFTTAHAKSLSTEYSTRRPTIPPGSSAPALAVIMTLLRLVLTRGLNVLDGIELCHKRLRWHKRPSRGSVSTRWIKWIRWHCPDFLSYANLIPFKTWNKSTSSPVLLGRLFHLRRSNEWTYNW